MQIQKIKLQKILPCGIALLLCLALCSTFVRYGANDSYFLLFPFSVGTAAVCLSALLLSLKRKHACFRFTWADGLLLFAAVWYAVRYDNTLHLADWKVIYAALLLCLWFAARIIFATGVLKNNRFFSFCLALAGCVLAGWGLLQLYGFLPSNHYLYRLTGPFFNPGPYSGYLAMLLPVCLHGWLADTGNRRYAWMVAFALMFCILPAAMSRSAWVAIIVSLLWVLARQKGWFAVVKKALRHTPGQTVSITMAGMLVIIAAGLLLFQLKPDSVRGRILIWKNTCQVVAERPLTGYGPGTFQREYGKAQAAHFASGEATPAEERVAGYAEYAFNDYLQLLVEGGLILLLPLLAAGIYVFRQGMRRREDGFCGALMAFAVFALSSYPLQILPFGMLLAVLGAACIGAQPYERRAERNSFFRPALQCLLSLLCLAGSGLAVWKLHGLAHLGYQWYVANSLYYSQLYEDAARSYEAIYRPLCYHPEFLKNYAGALNAEGKPLEACQVLNRARMVSCDFNILNAQGRYYQSAKQYQEAEQCFRQSLLLAPERLYPYYLLAKLYNEPGYLNIEKAKQMAKIVLTKAPKVHSRAVDEMREEMKHLLSR